MKLKKILTAVSGMILLLSAPCFANEISVTQDIETAEVTVEVKLGESYGNKRLMMYCLEDGSSVSDIAEEDETIQKTDKLYAVSYGECDGEGKYTFTDIVVNGESGKYVFYVTESGKGTVFKSDATRIVNSESVTSFVDAVSNASKSEIMSVIDDEIKNKNLGINIMLYEKLSPDGKEKAAEKLQNRVFDGIKAVELEINRVSVKAGIENAWDATALDMLICPDDYPGISDFSDIIKSENEMSLYATNPAVVNLLKLSPAERVKILDKALKISNGDALFDRISISVINSEIASCVGYGDITGVIGQYKDTILKELDFSKYNSSKYKNTVNKEMMNKSFNSAAELILYIEEALKKAENNDKGSSSSGGGGGGGNGRGSGGGSSATVKPNLTVGETILAPKKQETPEAAVKFTDMSGFDWAMPAVEYLTEQGIVSGRGNNCFDPSGLITREEFIKIVVCAFGTEFSDSVCGFSDIESGAWYEKYISAAVSAGIINGISENEFGTGMNITRQDVAVIAARAASAALSEAVTVFSDDAAIAEYAKAAVSWMHEKGYIGGYEDNSFKPSNFCTRAEAAKIIYGIIN